MEVVTKTLHLMPVTSAYSPLIDAPKAHSVFPDCSTTAYDLQSNLQEMTPLLLELNTKAVSPRNAADQKLHLKPKG